MDEFNKALDKLRKSKRYIDADIAVRQIMEAQLASRMTFTASENIKPTESKVREASETGNWARLSADLLQFDAMFVEEPGLFNHEIIVLLFKPKSTGFGRWITGKVPGYSAEWAGGSGGSIFPYANEQAFIKVRDAASLRRFRALIKRYEKEYGQILVYNETEGYIDTEEIWKYTSETIRPEEEFDPEIYIEGDEGPTDAEPVIGWGTGYGHN